MDILSKYSFLGHASNFSVNAVLYLPYTCIYMNTLLFHALVYLLQFFKDTSLAVLKTGSPKEMEDLLRCNTIHYG